MKTKTRKKKSQRHKIEDSEDVRHRLKRKRLMEAQMEREGEETHRRIRLRRGLGSWCGMRLLVNFHGYRLGGRRL
jgi:hypothetical protein